MSERTFFDGLLAGWFLLAALVFVALSFMVAPYGRHVRKGWGPTVGNRAGWVIMESMAPVMFAGCFVLGTSPTTLASLAFLGMWEVHYLHRAFIYPFGLRGSRRMPLAIVGMGLLFNAGNGYLNGRYLFSFSGGYAADWLRDPRFMIGLALFGIGFVINRQADRILRGLRAEGETGYRTPGRWLYRWVSCPNYLGEIIIWCGWAVATWSVAGLAFAVWTVANLAPRARAHHAWYLEHLADYPTERKALLPGLW